ncbi:IS66 family transposase [Pigmentiphaga sp. GD03639]|uniref:IS66 family transposase n=1 Tax=unclassified Pigmentiphaga TaxID=2626614 RepID=UPI000B41A917|nr:MULTISPECIES: IS66 family transposase [unclassified Pigmentiphaga]MDH2240286.1 IS66 family transposase [Pigmentiphaga sp. GD03639]OVZ54618.1 Mobile element protein [Pigmentiphaga sp. NML080357]
MPNTVTITAEEYEALQAALRVVTVERDLLKEQLKAFQRKLFAAKSEARGSGQKDLFFNEAEALAPGEQASPAREEDGATAVKVAGHTRKQRGRKPLDPGLPRVEVRHELPVSERVCPHDGQALVEIGVEISEQLDIVPQQIRVVQHQRVKYACPCCDAGIKTTPAPARVIPKGLLTESALAWCITAKYQDGLPLYRQAGLLNRFGGDLSRATLAASVVRVGKAVQPLINLLRDHLLDADVLYGDETTVQVLKEPGRAAQSKSFLWAQMNGAGPPIRLFTYSPTRNTAQAATLYAGSRRDAALMTDGYAPYDAVAERYGLVHLGCWAHARRYLIEAQEALPKAQQQGHPAAACIEGIGKLFAVEQQAKDMTPEQRQQLRAAQSRPVLAEIETLLTQHLHSVLPQSLFGKALHYLHGQWPKLIRYVDNGSWPISNNPCENAIRPFVVGRRGWLFCDTVAGAHASANLYSLVETAKANGIDPYQYLQSMLKALPYAQTADDYEKLLPWNMATPAQPA